MTREPSEALGDHPIWDELRRRQERREQRRERAEEFTRKMAKEESKESDAPPIPDDPYGIIRVFAAHLAMSLDHMHPVRAFEASQHATREYLASYEFKDYSSKDSNTLQFRMFPKRSSK